jgi:hypothetical protein
VTRPPRPGPTGPVQPMRQEPPKSPGLAEGAELPGECHGPGYTQPPPPTRHSGGQVIQMSRLLCRTAAAISGSRGAAEPPHSPDGPREPEGAPRDATAHAQPGQPATGAVMGFLRGSWPRKTPLAP